jgi:hypothetical protein
LGHFCLALQSDVAPRSALGINLATAMRELSSSISINPLANDPWADACGWAPAVGVCPQDLSNNSFSTSRRLAGILMKVNPLFP